MKANIDEELIMDLYVNQNVSVKDIALQIGSSPATVQRRLKKMGVLRTGHKKVKADIEVLRRMYIDENKTMKEISEELGLSFSTVAQNLDCAGIKKDKAAIRETYEKTMADRYGVTVPMLSEDIRTKIEQTNLARYGTRMPLECPKIHAQTIAAQNKRAKKQ